MTTTRTPTSGAADKVLAYLDDLSDDAAAHIFPSDLAKCMTSECVVEVVSVRAGNPNERTVPLFSREQVVAALASTPAQPVAEPAGAADSVQEDAAELDFLKSDLLSCVQTVVGNGGAHHIIEDAYERYEAWLASKSRMAVCHAGIDATHLIATNA